MQKGRIYIASRNKFLCILIHHWIYFSMSSYKNPILLLVAFMSNYVQPEKQNQEVSNSPFLSVSGWVSACCLQTSARSLCSTAPLAVEGT